MDASGHRRRRSTPSTTPSRTSTSAADDVVTDVNNDVAYPIGTMTGGRPEPGGYAVFGNVDKSSVASPRARLCYSFETGTRLEIDWNYSACSRPRRWKASFNPLLDAGIRTASSVP